MERERGREVERKRNAVPNGRHGDFQGGLRGSLHEGGDWAVRRAAKCHACDYTLYQPYINPITV